MAKIGSTLTIILAVAVGGSVVVACSDDDAGRLGRPGSSGNAASGGVGGDGGPGSSGGPNGGPPPEEVLFRALEPDLQQKCGGQCHTDGTYKPAPPVFLAPPDAYKSIKAAPGMVTPDYYQSALLQKGAHAGPAVGTDPTFEEKVIAWLKMESAVIQSQRKPSTDPITLTNGPNDVDLTKAAIGGLSGVHLKFNASLVGNILSLSGLKLVAPAGTDVHILKPRFIKVLPKPDETNRSEIPDPADSFSNSDQTVPGGAETELAPGSALFAGAGWTPFDFATDKIRIEIDKLEPGKVQVISAPKVCANVAMFTANVLPALRGQAGGFLNCANCHGNGLAGLSLNNADQALVCNQVLLKLNLGNLAQSIMVTKVTVGPHNGGITPNAGAFPAVFTGNPGVWPPP
ncbi:MAG: hypothetical protein KF819_19710 [Labilithrix sp.]|nr:hypothetical protein [Labilithrix sp.]